MSDSEDIAKVESGEEKIPTESSSAYENLSEKHKRFVDEFTIDLNATQAYIRAGYSEKGASGAACKLQAIASVCKSIEEKLAERRQSNAVLIEKVRRYWDNVMESVDLTDSASIVEANKASELLMKHVGGFEKDNEQSAGAPVINFYGGARVAAPTYE